MEINRFLAKNQTL